MKTIKVPDIEGPTVQLCWAQNFPTAENPAPKNAMTRCDRRKGHGGMHTWELAELVREALHEPADVGPRPEVETLIEKWRARAKEHDARKREAADAHHEAGEHINRAKMLAFEDCADELEAALRAVGVPAGEKKSE